MSKEVVDAFVAPHPDSIEAVDSWLQHHNINPADISRQTGGGEWLLVRVTVAQAERMLNTKYNVYEHPASGERVVRTLSYSLPQELHAHVDVAAPTTYFGTARSMKTTSFLQPHVSDPSHDAAITPDLSGAAVPASCASTITPACLRALYNTAAYVPSATNVNKLGVAGYLEEFGSSVLIFLCNYLNLSLSKHG